MLRWIPKNVSMAIAMMMLCCVGELQECRAQNNAETNAVSDSGSSQPPAHPNAYYEKPDLRKPAVHPESAVIRKSSSNPPFNSGSQRDFIHQQYQELLSQSQGRAAPNQKQKAFIGSYHIQGRDSNYVRKQLPPRLIPPKQSGETTSPYSLKQQPAASIGTAPYPNPNLESAATSYQRRQMPPIHSQQLYPHRPIQQPIQSPTNLPPIVQPNHAPGSISQPVYYLPELEPGRQQTKPKHSHYQIQRSPIRPTSNQAPKAFQGTTQIPATFSPDESKVTKARIIFQDGGDPFGQSPELKDQQQESQTNDPFGESNVDSTTQNRQDAFDDPPDDLTQQDPKQDPFADPPQDQSNNNQDPFGQEPSRIRDVDPSPAIPNNIQPGEQFQIPDGGSDSEETSPNEDPNRNRRTKPDRSHLPSGPFKQQFQPTPIQPAPARREFEDVVVPSIVATQPTYPDTFYDGHADQPSYFEQGFSKSDLYEGIRVPSAESHYDGTCDDSYYCRPRLVDRFNLPGHLANAKSAAYSLICGSCGMNCGGQCDQRMGNDCEWECDDCFEPSFYFSVFGGYVQLEDIGPFQGVITGQTDAYNFNDGFGIGGAIGQIQGENLRTELEFAFRHNDADQFVTNGAFAGPAFTSVDGSAEVYTGMVNFVWDFCPRPIFGCNRLYAGAGIGFAVVDIDSRPVNALSALENQTSFAYQLMAGISRPVSFRSDAFVEYRYLNADSIFASTGLGPVEFEYETDNIFFGLRAFF